jgi:hypothetical protein
MFSAKSIATVRAFAIVTGGLLGLLLSTSSALAQDDSGPFPGSVPKAICGPGAYGKRITRPDDATKQQLTHMKRTPKFRGLVIRASEMDDVLRASEQGQMAQDDHAVETAIYQGQQAAKQLCEGLESVPSFDSCVENKIIGQGTDGDQNFKYVWGSLSGRRACSRFHSMSR